MTERLKELAMENGYVSWNQDNKCYELNADISDFYSFAELIVRECVDQIQPMWNRVQEIGPPPGYDYDTFDLAYNDCMNAIKEHFGVEE